MIGESGSRNISDRSSTYLERALCLLWAGLPALLCLDFIGVFGVNVPIHDDWNLVPLIKSFLDGEMQVSELYVQHNEHRLFFPKLMIVIVSKLTSANVKWEMYVGWAFIGLSTLVIWLLLRESPKKMRWLAIPLAWFMYSPAQYQDLLQGIAAIQWFSTVFFALLTIYLLQRSRYSSILLVPAVASAWLASLSSILGLLVWIVGLGTFVGKGMRRRLLPATVWLGAGVTVWTLYFSHYVQPSYHPSPLLFLSAPFAYVRFVFTLLGSAFQGCYLLGCSSLFWSMISGIAMSLAMIVAVFLMPMFHVNRVRLIPWFQIATFALLSAAAVGVGRLGFGVPTALESKYVVISTLFTVSAVVIASEPLRATFERRSQLRWANKTSAFACILILAGITVTGLAAGYFHGWVLGQTWFDNYSTALTCVMSPTTDLECLKRLHGDLHPVLTGIEILRGMSLGPFAPSAVAPLARQWFFTEVLPRLIAGGIIGGVFFALWWFIDRRS